MRHQRKRVEPWDEAGLAAVALPIVGPAAASTWREAYDGDAEAMPFRSMAWAGVITRAGNDQNVSRAYCFVDGANMGETGNSNNFALFKSRFGAGPVPFAEYLFERIPILPSGDRLRGLIKLLIGFGDA